MDRNMEFLGWIVMLDGADPGTDRYSCDSWDPACLNLLQWGLEQWNGADKEVENRGNLFV
jgi:hypothetical protein